MSPSQLSIFRSRTGIMIDRTYLTIKGLWFEHQPDIANIFAVNTAVWRGFEITNGRYDATHIHLILFNAADQEIVMDISVGTSSIVRLRQADINGIIKTLRPISN